jgi:ribosomal-protein-alanine N-acetyltransferase
MTPFDLGAFDPPLMLPRLECGPVVLRPFDPSDLLLVLEASTDSYVPSITSLPASCTEAGGLSFIERQGEQARSGHGYSLVIASADGTERGLGAVGLWLRDIENGRATVGYWLVESARGAGAAGWALRGLVAFAFDGLAIPRLQLYIEPWNEASVRTAVSAGFAHEAHLRGWERIDGEQHDVDCYSLLRAEWNAP